MQTITNERKVSQKRAPVQAGVTVKFGLDVHAAQITVCRQIDGQVPQPAQRFGWSECIDWIEAHVQAGAVVHSCYEAGPCGYGLHRKLTQLGVTNHVVVPQRWDEQNKRVKTDARDARELCDRLDRYARGNTTAFGLVRVPTPEQEQRRALGRQRDMVGRERQRCAVAGSRLIKTLPRIIRTGRLYPSAKWKFNTAKVSARNRLPSALQRAAKVKLPLSNFGHCDLCWRAKEHHESLQNRTAHNIHLEIPLKS